MKKIRSSNIAQHIEYLLSFMLVVFLSLLLWRILTFRHHKKFYSISMEFQNAYGIQEGTPLRLRGIKIGSVRNVHIDINSVLAIIQIDSSEILIPKNSIIETNQTGLLNDAAIDIIPLERINTKDNLNLDPCSVECNNSMIMCDKNHFKGDRGLNYDDLIRATTRISQRFDDPRFFKVFYIFLQNCIGLSDHLLDITFSISDIISTIELSLQKSIAHSTEK